MPDKHKVAGPSPSMPIYLKTSYDTGHQVLGYRQSKMLRQMSVLLINWQLCNRRSLNWQSRKMQEAAVRLLRAAILEIQTNNIA